MLGIFYEEALARLDQFYPMRAVTITSSDPQFLTPEIKHRRKNRMMRAGKPEIASALAVRIGRLIERANGNHLKKIDPRSGVDELWRCVGKLTCQGKHSPPDQVTYAEDLNKPYAAVSTDPEYTPSALRYTVGDNQLFITEIRSALGTPRRG